MSKEKVSLAVERARLSLESTASFKDAGMGAVRPLDLNTITEGTVVTMPDKLELFKQYINGTENFTWKMITKEDYDFYPSVLTRGATPLDGSPRVRPSGTAVEAVQKYSSMDEAYMKELAGKKLKFTKATTVVCKGYGTPTREVKVWQIDFN